ncbi:MAG TPA: DUF3144 domain-containing protein, partial [Sulfurovum sp.]|uniref:DUF3144 domain-containing protein n=1 Tax=Sulfurovum sp. TaxID=1969726 RepID=UPI002F950C0B
KLRKETMSQTQKPSKENKTDEQFYKRVDTLIGLANGYVKANVHPAFVNNSFMFAAARFNAWVAAAGYQNGEEMAKEKDEILNFFVNQYKLMLNENLDNYIENYGSFMGKSTDTPEEK